MTSKIYENLRDGRSIPCLNTEEIKSLQQPLGKAIYKYSIESSPETYNKKAHPNDRLICNICNGKYTRAHRSAHNKTKVHQAYANMNSKLTKLLLDQN